MYMQDEYHALSYKTMALWRLAEDNFDIDYLIKVDDDNFVRLDRLAIATHQWDEENAGVQPQSALSKVLISKARGGIEHPRGSFCVYVKVLSLYNFMAGQRTEDCADMRDLLLHVASAHVCNAWLASVKQVAC